MMRNKVVRRTALAGGIAAVFAMSMALPAFASTTLTHSVTYQGYTATCQSSATAVTSGVSMVNKTCYRVRAEVDYLNTNTGMTGHVAGTPGPTSSATASYAVTARWGSGSMLRTTSGLNVEAWSGVSCV